MLNLRTRTQIYCGLCALCSTWCVTRWCRHRLGAAAFHAVPSAEVHAAQRIVINMLSVEFHSLPISGTGCW